MSVPLSGRLRGEDFLVERTLVLIPSITIPQAHSSSRDRRFTALSVRNDLAHERVVVGRTLYPE